MEDAEVDLPWALLEELRSSTHPPRVVITLIFVHGLAGFDNFLRLGRRHEFDVSLWEFFVYGCQFGASKKEHGEEESMVFNNFLSSTKSQLGRMYSADNRAQDAESNSLSNVPAQRPAAMVFYGLVLGCRESTFQTLGATSAYGNRYIGKAFVPTGRTDRDYQAPERAYFRGRLHNKDPCA